MTDTTTTEETRNERAWSLREIQKNPYGFSLSIPLGDNAPVLDTDTRAAAPRSKRGKRTQS